MSEANAMQPQWNHHDYMILGKPAEKLPTWPHPKLMTMELWTNEMAAVLNH